jgi:beta-RFAP synthase
MIRVRAPSRLHFGLLCLPTEDVPAKPHEELLPHRHFGGVGLMVQDPGVHLTARPACAWSAVGPLAERALAFAEEFCHAVRKEGVREPPHPHHFVLEGMAPEHAGLGTGTQLGLAVARALTESCGLGSATATDLARWVSRGARSALGVHGFVQGGFLVEAGKTSKDALAPLVARLPFPEQWCIVLVLPKGSKGLHGVEENQAFQHLLTQRRAASCTDILCRLVLLGMLPALVERNVGGFGEALYEFNRRVGEAFRLVQGGTYAHPASEEVLSFIRRHDIPGVGQSSWGPALFAVTADLGQGVHLAARLRQQFSFSPTEVFVTAAANAPARVGPATACANPL